MAIPVFDKDLGPRAAPGPATDGPQEDPGDGCRALHTQRPTSIW